MTGGWSGDHQYDLELDRFVSLGRFQRVVRDSHSFSCQSDKKYEEASWLQMSQKNLSAFAHIPLTIWQIWKKSAFINSTLNQCQLAKNTIEEPVFRVHDWTWNRSIRFPYFNNTLQDTETKSSHSQFQDQSYIYYIFKNEKNDKHTTLYTFTSLYQALTPYETMWLTLIELKMTCVEEWSGPSISPKFEWDKNWQWHSGTIPICT